MPEDEPMRQHPFLSDGWIAAAKALREAHRDTLEPLASTGVRMNLVVEDVPFDAGVLEAHLDTSLGLVDIDLGHVASADVRVTLAYSTAQALLVDGDAESAFQAFMAGRIRVEGDLAALLGAFSGPTGVTGGAVAADLRAITTPRPAQAT